VETGDRMIGPLRWIAAIVLFAGAGAAFAVDIGDPAPTFNLPVLASGDRHVGLDNLRGKVVLIDFWASWCGPCRQSLPLYEKLRSELPPADFQIVAVNLDEETADVTSFLEEHPVNYTILRDPPGNVAKAFGLRWMPSSYLLDRDGVVRLHNVGFKPADMNALRSEIHNLLGKPADAH